MATLRKKYSLYSPTAGLQRRLYSRGRSSTLWAGLAGAFMVLRVVRRLVTRQQEIAATDRLKPGETLMITAIAPPTRRQRKAARRAGAGE